RGGKLSRPYAGFQIGRRVQLTNADFEDLGHVPGIEQKSARMNLKSGGPFNGGNMMIRRGIKANSFDIESVHPDQQYLDAAHVAFGRFINAEDIRRRRKSVVI